MQQLLFPPGLSNWAKHSTRHKKSNNTGSSCHLRFSEAAFAEQRFFLFQVNNVMFASAFLRP